MPSNPNRTHFRAVLWLCSLLCLGILGISLWPGLPGYAQVPAGSWDQPTNISNSPSDSNYPTVTADPSGGVHVVWSDIDEDGRSFLSYARLKNGSWIPSNEILTSPVMTIALYPSLGADSQGFLHVVWTDGMNLYYSKAFSDLASSSQSWSDPQSLEYVRNNITTPHLVIDSQDVLHVVYAISIGEDSGIYYTSSADHGRNWSEPVTINKNFRSDIMVEQPRLAIGDQGDFHVVWTEYNYPDTFPGIGIRYARSLTGPVSWENSISLAEGPFRDPTITTLDNGQVHVVWSGTQPERYKFHRMSNDRGETWEEIFRNEEIGGYQGYPALAVDSEQGLHWLAVGSDFQTGFDSLAYFQWQAGGWSEGEKTTPNYVSQNNPMNVSAAVASGNELHIVVSYPVENSESSKGYQMEIYYFFRQLNSPRLEPQVISQPTPTSLPTPRSEETAQIQSFAITPTINQTPSNTSQATSGPFMAGALAATVFLAIGILVKMISSRKRN
jgi:hypothetical protein